MVRFLAPSLGLDSSSIEPKALREARKHEGLPIRAGRLGLFLAIAICSLQTSAAIAQPPTDSDGQAASSTAELLQEYRQVRQEVLSSAKPELSDRETAFVLAWGECLAELEKPLAREREDFVKQNIGNRQFVEQQLAEALRMRRQEGDSFEQKRYRFLSGYVSAIDNSGQFYDLQVPPDYKPTQPYPLEVYPRTEVRYHGPYDWVGPKDRFVLRCSGRGGGIVTLGELDALEALREVRRHYNIDRDRICLRGGSIGGGGAWRLAARYPDMWAAAQIDYGWSWTERLQIENVANLPMWLYHDTKDTWVPVDESRLPAKYLGCLGAPIIYSETIGGGHSGRLKNAGWDQSKWLSQQRRVPLPALVTYTTTTVERGRCHWLQILEFGDPNVLASVRARAQAANDGSTALYLNTENVDVLRVSLPAALFPRGMPLVVFAGGEQIRVDAPLPAELYLSHIVDNGRWRITPSDPRTPSACRPYSAGGLNLMYTSPEPLLIVCGAAGEKEYAAALRDFSDRLSCQSFGWWPFAIDPFATGRIPVVTDVELTQENVDRCNLILIGSASSNKVLARITARLPAVEDGGELRVVGEKYPLAGRAYGLFHYNPESPRRFVFVLSSPEAAFYRNTTNNILLQRMGDERPLGLELMDLAPPRWVRQIPWTKGWTAPPVATADEHLPAEFGKAGGGFSVYLDAMRRATGSEFALYWPVELPTQTPWDTNYARWEDMRAEVGQASIVYVGLVPGANLRKLADLHQAGKSGLARWPELRPDRLDPKGQYRVCLDPRLAKELNNDSGEPLREAKAILVDVCAEMERISLLDKPAAQ